MTARRFALAFVPLALVASLASARDTTAPADPAGLVAARQASMAMSGAVFGGLMGRSRAGGSPREGQFGAQALARWAHAVPAMFPAGTGPDAVPATKARPAIWRDRADFEAKAAAYAAAADRLAALAQADDKEGFAAQLTEVRNSCGACHATYRVEDAH